MWYNLNPTVHRCSCVALQSVITNNKYLVHCPVITAHVMIIVVFV